jgi:DNA modification methylase
VDQTALSFGRGQPGVDVSLHDIHPKSPILRLGQFTEEERATEVDAAVAATVVGMSFNFVMRAVGNPSGSRRRTITLQQVLDLLELDGFEETFVPRSQVPRYLLISAKAGSSTNGLGKQLDLPTDTLAPFLYAGHAGDLMRQLPAKSIQCAVTSSPYWGMRIYDNPRVLRWADGEHCSYGFEQTPEGFIRHTTELLYLMKPALTDDGSVWWNLMDTYNTRTPIRGSSRDKLRAMGDDPEHALGWTEHEACRHSAGHMYLKDGELAMIPARVAERASRIGYTVKSYITWNKHSTPEPVKSRVTRQAEIILHLSAGPTPYFDKPGWLTMKDPTLGGWDAAHESSAKLTDVWYLPTAQGKNGHGAEFPLALPARCIQLTTKRDDVVLDPFLGSGTTALAAMRLGRRCVGFDTSRTYIERATTRIDSLAQEIRASVPLLESEPEIAVNHVKGAKKKARQTTGGGPRSK